MQPRKSIALLIGISLVFAALIVACDRLTEGTAFNNNITYLLVAAWLVPFCFILAKSRPANNAPES
ncbi:hypothetical protein Pan14r_51710 [Crateriforma conspicua]|uniref:Uncharacterized protein n=1 Tax=Crateriforma conspicua TaxID=2527996 RepID=A0A5C5XRV0_9PLAN|nr:hypothetical protein Mal65_54180 [Crateriforma conspicua]TWT65624.1 hypothetical protein Pan14r_51710 [Crateriforma conspicua]